MLTTCDCHDNLHYNSYELENFNYLFFQVLKKLSEVSDKLHALNIWFKLLYLIPTGFHHMLGAQLDFIYY